MLSYFTEHITEEVFDCTMYSDLLLLAFCLAIPVAFADGKIHANYQAQKYV